MQPMCRMPKCQSLQLCGQISKSGSIASAMFSMPRRESAKQAANTTPPKQKGFCGCAVRLKLGRYAHISIAPRFVELDFVEVVGLRSILLLASLSLICALRTAYTPERWHGYSRQSICFPACPDFMLRFRTAAELYVHSTVTTATELSNRATLN